MKHYHLLFLFLILFGCAEDESAAETFDLPNTPEAVVKAYQAFLDKNNFTDAKRLSTSTEQERLDAIAQIIETEPLDSTVFNTIFLEISCQTNANKALCACLLEDFEEKYRDTFHLVKQNNQWLVDAQEENFSIESDVLFDDFIHEELEKETSEH